MVFRCRFFFEVFSDGFWDVDFVEFVYRVFVYGSSNLDYNSYEGAYFSIVVS